MRLIVVLLVVIVAVTVQGELSCKRFDQIYLNGKDLCERIYGDSFQYVDKSNLTLYNMAYNMWFFSSNNPNDAITQARIKAGIQTNVQQYPNITSTCWLAGTRSKHKEKPSSESNLLECAPFRENSCCKPSTVKNTKVINEAYGPFYRWDRCGKMSQQCERFFVQESCFYECDPNIGYFRRYPPGDIWASPNRNWEVYKVPIQGDYCDMWFHSCSADLFCGEGNFFGECTKTIKTKPPTRRRRGKKH